MDCPLPSLPPGGLALDVQAVLVLDDVVEAYEAAHAHWSTLGPTGAPAQRNDAALKWCALLLLVAAGGMVTGFLSRGQQPPLMLGTLGTALLLALVFGVIGSCRQGWAIRSATAKLMRKLQPELGRDGVLTFLRVSPSTLEVAQDGTHLRHVRQPGAIVKETPRGFVVVAGSLVVPVPVRDLAPAVVAALRSVLADWGLQAVAARSPAQKRLHGGMGIVSVVAVAGLAFAATFHRPAAIPAAAAPATTVAPATPDPPRGSRDRVSLALPGLLLAVPGGPMPVRNARYAARTNSGFLRDSLDGDARGTAARGHFYIERQAHGFTPYTRANVPRTTFGGPDKVGPMPDDAALTLLENDGLLFEWAYAGEFDMLVSCAVLYAFRDPLPPGTAGYRRSMNLEFCSTTMGGPTLARWMQEAAEALDKAFTGLARR